MFSRWRRWSFSRAVSACRDTRPSFRGPRDVRVECLNDKGERNVIEASGWYARILQHEIDHLQGTLYIDRMLSRTFCCLISLADSGKTNPLPGSRQRWGCSPPFLPSDILALSFVMQLFRLVFPPSGSWVLLMACGLATAQQLPEAPSTQSSGQKPATAGAPESSPPQNPRRKPHPRIRRTKLRRRSRRGSFPPPPSATIARGCVREGGDITDAIAEYKDAIKDYPDYFDAHFNLGRLYSDKQGYLDAIKEFKEAVRLRPNDADAHNNLGLAMKRNGDLNGAILEYREAVQLNPKLASAQNNLANVLYARRDFTGAIQHYRAALEVEPKSAQTRMNLASALDDAGKPDDAIAEYKEALKLDPKNAKIHYNLSIVYQKKKDMPAAIAELKEAAAVARLANAAHHAHQPAEGLRPQGRDRRVHGRRRAYARCQAARSVPGIAEEGAVDSAV